MKVSGKCWEGKSKIQLRSVEQAMANTHLPRTTQRVAIVSGRRALCQKSRDAIHDLEWLSLIAFVSGEDCHSDMS